MTGSSCQIWRSAKPPGPRPETELSRLQNFILLTNSTILNRPLSVLNTLVLILMFTMVRATTKLRRIFCNYALVQVIFHSSQSQQRVAQFSGARFAALKFPRAQYAGSQFGLGKRQGLNLPWTHLPWYGWVGGSTWVPLDNYPHYPDFRWQKIN